jgi:hypothetical protein
MHGLSSARTASEEKKQHRGPEREREIGRGQSETHRVRLLWLDAMPERRGEEALRHRAFSSRGARFSEVEESDIAMLR